MLLKRRMGCWIRRCLLIGFAAAALICVHVPAAAGSQAISTNLYAARPPVPADNGAAAGRLLIEKFLFDGLEPAPGNRSFAADRYLAQDKPRLYSSDLWGKEQLPQQGTIRPQRWQWSLAAGYRKDDLQWNFGGNLPDNPQFNLLLPGLPAALAGTFVNILSELTWTDLEIFQLEFELQRSFSNNVRLKGSLGYGIIIDGDNQDSDYAGDNRTLEFSRSNNSADDGDVWDLSVAVGYDVNFSAKRFVITPLFGLSYHAQNVNMSKGVQTVANFGFPVPLGPFDGLDSTYDADWYGPWTGVDASFTLKGKDGVAPAHRFWAGFEWHFYAEFEAKAYWNLRDDRFEHDTDGSGWVVSGGYNWFINPRWSLDLKGKYQEWETDPGTHQWFFSGGSTAVLPLNEVLWDSYSVTFGVTCRW